MRKEIVVKRQSIVREVKTRPNTAFENDCKTVVTTHPVGGVVEDRMEL